MGVVGFQEVLLIAVVALAFFAPRHIPKLGRAAGEAAREFRGVRKTVEDTKEVLDAELKKSVEL